MSEVRRLEEYCLKCGYPTKEETREYRGERLAVSFCLNPKCDFFDWECPSEYERIEEDEAISDEECMKLQDKILSESGEWAEEQAKIMKANFYSKQPITFEIPINKTLINEYLVERNLALSTEENYRRVLYGFYEWLSLRRKGGEKGWVKRKRKSC